MPILAAVVILFVLALIALRVLPGLFRSFGENADHLRKAQEKITEQLNKQQENWYWNQYDADESQDVTRRWQRLPDGPRDICWAPRGQMKRGRVQISPVL